MITWPNNTKEIIDDIRDTIGREITINVKVPGDPCPDCDLDPITGVSTDSYCTTCSGLYWINTISGSPVMAHVRWTKIGQPIYEPGGIIYDGDCIVTITYSDENLNNVINSDSFIVDGKDLYMKNYVLRGVQDINRIRIILLEDRE